MPHAYNRVAFQSLAAGSNVLLCLYCSLVALELGIKDHFAGAGWRNGHRIVDWISELGETALSVQLANELGALMCTARDGNAAPVVGNSYPDLRYLRHASDFAGSTTDAQIQQALGVLTDIRNALVGRGVAL